MNDLIVLLLAFSKSLRWLVSATRPIFYFHMMILAQHAERHKLKNQMYI